jgi:hypothetical protein
VESPKVVQSLGRDPGHHEELRNSPEVKIHIWKVVIGFRKKFEFFRYCTRKVLEGSGVGPTCMGDPHERW